MKEIKLYEIKNLVEAEIKLPLGVKKRTRPYVIGRFIYGKLAKEYTSESLQNIAKEINRHHCSVLHYLNNFEPFYKQDVSLQKKYDKLKKDLNRIIGLDDKKNIVTQPKKIHPYRLRNAPQSLRRLFKKRR